MTTLQIELQGLDKFRGKLVGLDRTIKTKFIPELLIKGKMYARSIAPQDTGELKSAIYPTDSDKMTGKLVAHMPRHKDGRKRPYHMWMHGIGRYDTSTGRYAPKSGDPMFMFTTEKYLRKKAPQIINRFFKEKGL